MAILHYIHLKISPITVWEDVQRFVSARISCRQIIPYVTQRQYNFLNQLRKDLLTVTGAAWLIMSDTSAPRSIPIPSIHQIKDANPSDVEVIENSTPSNSGETSV